MAVFRSSDFPRKIFDYFKKIFSITTQPTAIVPKLYTRLVHLKHTKNLYFPKPNLQKF